MMMKRMSVSAICGLLGVVMVLPAGAAAQIAYPSFQVPHVAEREFNFAIADASKTTTLVFQWREGVGPRSQMSFDGGFADVDRGDGGLTLLLGAQYAYQLARSTSADAPLDALFTVGAFARVGNDDVSALSIPVGVSVGHRFLLDDGMAITPYAHPRLSVDVWDDDSEVNINVDIGASFDFSSQFGLRFSATLGEVDALGLSLAWRPLGLRR
jgi:hypothetical protein